MPAVAREQRDAVDHDEPVDALGEALRPQQPDDAPVVHNEAHARDADVIKERLDEAVIAGHREVAVAALAAAPEAGQVGRDAARALEEDDPVVTAGRCAVEVEHGRIVTGRLAPEQRLVAQRIRVFGDRDHRRDDTLRGVSPASGEPAWRRPPARRVRAVRDRLQSVYGVPVMAPHGDPLGELVLTVLSQSTNDRNRDVAFGRLRERLPSWEAVRDAPLAEVEEAIRPGGISKVKSLRIQQLLRAIGDPLELSRMRDAPVERSRDYLRELPGVGRKTAACVLLFAYGLRDVPVDTHVSRVGSRLRLLEPGAPSQRLHDQMLAITPPGAELELHVNLLRHGRRTCHARAPECDACALARMCPARASFA